MSAPANPARLVPFADAKEAIEGHRWRERLTARTFEWFGRKRQWQEARQLAWGDLQNEWHDLHGRRWPAWQCAGCGKPIGGFDAIELPDGNRVHVEPIDCLIGFGRRWRNDADTALIGLGLERPAKVGSAFLRDYVLDKSTRRSGRTGRRSTIEKPRS